MTILTINHNKSDAKYFLAIKILISILALTHINLIIYKNK